MKKRHQVQNKDLVEQLFIKQNSKMIIIITSLLRHSSDSDTK